MQKKGMQKHWRNGEMEKKVSHTWCKKKKAKRMIVLMASTCLQNDCQKQPRQASDFTWNHQQRQRQRERDRGNGREKDRWVARSWRIVSMPFWFALALLFRTCDCETLELVICLHFISTAISTPFAASLSHLAIVCVAWQKVTQSCNQLQQHLILPRLKISSLFLLFSLCFRF